MIGVSILVAIVMSVCLVVCLSEDQKVSSWSEVGYSSILSHDSKIEALC